MTLAASALLVVLLALVLAREMRLRRALQSLLKKPGFSWVFGVVVAVTSSWLLWFDHFPRLAYIINSSTKSQLHVDQA